MLGDQRQARYETFRTTDRIDHPRLPFLAERCADDVRDRILVVRSFRPHLHPEDAIQQSPCPRSPFAADDSFAGVDRNGDGRKPRSPEVAPGGVEPPRTDSKSVALSAELRGLAAQRSGGHCRQSPWRRALPASTVSALR